MARALRNPYTEFPATPPGIAEWEDLLVRFELAPRLVSAVLDEIPRDRWEQPIGADLRSPRDHVAHLAVRESQLRDWLEALQCGEPLSDGDADDKGPHDPARTEVLLDRFARVRDRNVAAAQRRGLEVWSWTAPHPEWGPVTAYQLLSAAVHHDGHHVRRLRAAC